MEILGIVKAPLSRKNGSVKAATSRPHWQCVSTLFVLLLFIHLGAFSKLQAQVALSEYQAKATYLFNFLKFVEWPEGSFPNPSAPIVIGIIGDGLLSSVMQRVVFGKSIQGHELIIHAYRDGDDLRGVHILFIGASERKRLPAILAGLRGSSVLTVADMDKFLDEGGMIQLVNENDPIRFAINLSAVSQARLKISSKLLSLAKVVTQNVKEGSR